MITNAPAARPPLVGWRPASRILLSLRRPSPASAMLLLALGSIILATTHMAHSTWMDEARTMQIARQSGLDDVVRLATTDRPYPPLYFLVAHGALRIHNDVVSVRLVSTLFGTLAVVFVFLLGKTLISAEVGIIAALLFLATPGALRYFVDGNAYTLLVLLNTASTYWLFKAVSTDRARHWAFYVGTALLGLGTHLLFIFHVAAQLVAAIVLRAHRRGPKNRSESVASSPASAWRTERKVMASGSVVLLAWLVGAVLYAMHGGRQQPFNLGRLWSLNTPILFPAMYMGALAMGSIVQLLVWPALQLLGWWVCFTRFQTVFVFVGLLIALPLIGITLFVETTLSFVAYRYALGLFPLTCIVAACAWIWRASPVPDHGPEHPAPRVAARLAVGIFAVAGAVSLALADARVFEYQDWKGTVSYVSERVQDEDAIVLSNASAVPFAYYYARSIKPHTFPRDEVVFDVVTRLLDSTEKRPSTLWVVLSTTGNRSDLIGSFTESARRPLDAQARDLIERLRDRGHHVELAQEFLRTCVLAVR